MDEQRFGRTKSKRTGSCSMCGDSYAIDAWIAFDNWEAQPAPTCLRCANKEIDAGHGTWKRATPKDEALAVARASRSDLQALRKDSSEDDALKSIARSLARLVELAEKHLGETPPAERAPSRMVDCSPEAKPTPPAKPPSAADLDPRMERWLNHKDQLVRARAPHWYKSIDLYENYEDFEQENSNRFLVPEQYEFMGEFLGG